MSRFDAERYLRLAGERALLQPGSDRGHRWSSPVDDAAQALLAVGAINGANAQRVIADYGLAQAMRDRNRAHGAAMGHRGRTPARARPLRFDRVVPLDTVIEDAQGRLEILYAVLGEPESWLGVVHRPAGPGRRRSRRAAGFMFVGGGGSWQNRAPTLTDDRGTSTTLGFSGHGSDTEWTGRLSTSDRLSATTRWLELDGRRIELDCAPVGAEVSVEEAEEPDPARRYLWQLVALAQPPFGSPESIDAAVEAMIAARALDPGDPSIAQAQSVREHLPRHRGHAPGAAGRRALPEPWRSLLARSGKQDGPEGTLVVGAVTPLFDEHRVGVLSVASEATSFSVEVTTTPGLTHHRFGGETDRQLAWWARDDRGNHYLGSQGSWSGGGDYGGGELGFWPSLDPRARRLEICPTALSARGVVSFPLDWKPAT
ncbi:MAG: hypothetical protein ABSH51_16120 [Solirubrobacteraceae bacterium]